MAGSPMALLLGKTATHFMPIRSSRPVPSAPRRNAGIAWTARIVGARVDADLGRQLRVRDERGHGPFGEVQPIVEVAAWPP